MAQRPCWGVTAFGPKFFVRGNFKVPCNILYFYSIWILEYEVWGAWVARSVKCLTLDFSSGHDLTILEFEPQVGLCTNSPQPAWDSVSPSLCPSPAGTLSLSLSKYINLKKKYEVASEYLEVSIL